MSETRSLDLEHYNDIPRVSGLTVSPDGTRLVTAVDTVSADRKRFVTSLWEIDPVGQAPARRLTRSAPGEQRPAFLPDGSLLFASKRPDPEAPPPTKPDKPEMPALWVLPASGGEARLVANPAGGVEALSVARTAGTVVIASSRMRGAETGEQDRERREARRDVDVQAFLHEGYPIRFWDHDLGPGERRLFVTDPPREPDSGLQALRVATPDAARALDEQSFAITPDGSTIVCGWVREEQDLVRRGDVVAIDVASGDRRVLASEPGTVHDEIDMAPDGSAVVATRIPLGSYDEPGNRTLVVIDLATSEVRDLLPDFDLWPGHPRWTSDGTGVIFAADEQGRSPVFRVEVATGQVTRLSADGAFSDLCPSPDGRYVYALRSRLDTPPEPVRLDVNAADQTPVVLPGVTPRLELPGRLEEVHATAEDGSPLRAWLVLPEDASPDRPAPFVLWAHGGPHASFNTWTWRWSPWLLAERGYAVLLPDPALSTGYGQEFIRRGHGRWGDAPYTDLMRVTDAVLERPDLDSSRTAAMGGSFGGYMVNWIAGHTDRFRAIVTHASLWALDQFQGTTDDAYYWDLEFGDPNTQPERYELWSPNRFAADIKTPMLVIHGDLDDRVPVGEALRLWTDLRRHGVPGKFLLFPDENHWILKPGNARVWHETVLAFLDEHLLGKEFVRPSLL